MKARRNNPDPALLRELLRYDRATGRLFWLRREPQHFQPSATRTAQHICALWNVRYADTEAFLNKSRLGYMCGTLLGSHHKAHRVIVAMELGYWPVEVDHENGVRSDNRWKNLRPVASRREQMKNQMMPRRNKSGVIGISQETKSGRWVARIGNKYVASSACFETVLAKRRAAEIEHGYHLNHGKRKA